ncbi:hypothetical protein [Methylobacterium sp. JK268]
MPEKPTFDEFATWAQHNIGFDPNAKSLSTWVNSNIRIFLTTLENHPFYASLQALVEEYKATPKHNPINIVTPKIDLNVKSVSSIISKIYRINVVENKNFPEPSNNQ